MGMKTSWVVVAVLGATLIPTGIGYAATYSSPQEYCGFYATQSGIDAQQPHRIAVIKQWADTANKLSVKISTDSSKSGATSPYPQ